MFAPVGVADHGTLLGLPDDDHPGHPWLAGRNGGQTLNGDTTAGGALTLLGTAHATPGPITVNAAGGDVRSVVWTDYFAASTVVGFAAGASGVIWYTKLGDRVFVDFFIMGTSNAVSFSFTVPYTVTGSFATTYIGIRYRDNGFTSTTSGTARITAASSIINLYTNWNHGAWTNANAKYAQGQFWYQV